MTPYVLNPSQHFVLSDFKIFADLMDGCTLVTKKLITVEIKYLMAFPQYFNYEEKNLC